MQEPRQNHATIAYLSNRVAEEILGISARTRQRDFRVLRKKLKPYFDVPATSRGVDINSFEIWQRYRKLVGELGQKLAVKQLIREIQS